MALKWRAVRGASCTNTLPKLKLVACFKDGSGEVVVEFFICVIVWQDQFVEASMRLCKVKNAVNKDIIFRWLSKHYLTIWPRQWKTHYLTPSLTIKTVNNNTCGSRVESNTLTIWNILRPSLPRNPCSHNKKILRMEQRQICKNAFYFNRQTKDFSVTCSRAETFSLKKRLPWSLLEKVPAHPHAKQDTRHKIRCMRQHRQTPQR